jgi:hypothetical protein
MPKGRSNAKRPRRHLDTKMAHVEDCESDIEINEHTTVSSTLPYTPDEKTYSDPNFTKHTRRSKMEDLAAWMLVARYASRASQILYGGFSLDR